MLPAGDVRPLTTVNQMNVNLRMYETTTEGTADCWFIPN